MCFWILLFVLFVMMIASIPTYPYSRTWGYYPAGSFLFLVIVLLILWWLAWLPWWGTYPYWWGA